MGNHAGNHHGGLGHDISRLPGRRHLLGLLGGAALLGLPGCSDGPDRTASGRTSGPAGGGRAARREIPDETAGPFPGDGSNGPSVLTRSGIVRSDIRTSFGGASRVAAGIPLTIELTVTNSGGAYEGAAVYVWQCDREARYSMYSPGATAENYLRGVQAADRAGLVRFTSIFPAAYEGRWPHVHFEVYPSLRAATGPAKIVKTSQLAFPEDACNEAYATRGYENSIANIKRTTLADDLVFRDGHDLQLATLTGGPSTGYTARLAVPL